MSDNISHLMRRSPVKMAASKHAFTRLRDLCWRYHAGQSGTTSHKIIKK